MTPDFLIQGVLSSVLGGRARKRSRRAMRYLNGGGSIWTRPTTLLTAAGVAWGIYETLQRNSGGSPAPGGTSTPSTAMGKVGLPPLPGESAAAEDEDDREALRVVRLAIAAANADGVMNEKERAVVLQQAQEAGVRQVVERELSDPRPLAEIVGGVTDHGGRATLYVLAFTILRADEQVTGAERIFLAQLAHLLDLDPATVQKLEKDTGERIDALGDQGQPGG
jgi:uncharacterized membrane protein YebE (DUF533 family)